MKFQLILLSFIVLSSFQLLDVDGLRKAVSNVSEVKKRIEKIISRPALIIIQSNAQYFQFIIWRARARMCACLLLRTKYFLTRQTLLLTGNSCN